MNKSDQYCICVRVDESFAEFTSTCLLRKAIVATLQQFDVPIDAGVTLLITNDEDVQKLNRRFRNVDAPTDVLSFPAMMDDAEVALGGDEDTHYLGDIIVAYPYSSDQARDEGHKIEDALALLAIHGTLHLLNFDHDTAERQAEMWAMQETILASVGVPLSVMPPPFELSAENNDNG
ncbi:rRNA maturation RNase YbeY [Chloroflexota bacterium]